MLIYTFEYALAFLCMLIFLMFLFIALFKLFHLFVIHNHVLPSKLCSFVHYTFFLLFISMKLYTPAVSQSPLLSVADEAGVWWVLQVSTSDSQTRDWDTSYLVVLSLDCQLAKDWLFSGKDAWDSLNFSKEADECFESFCLCFMLL